jgi:hypothetical protein
MMPRRSLRALGMVLFVWAAVFALRAVPVGGVWHALQPTTAALLAVWLVLFSAGWLLAVMLSGAVHANCAEPATLERKAAVLALIAATGALLVAYEFAVLRGYGFALSVAEIRLLEVDAAQDGRSASAISGIGRLLVPSLLVAWVLLGHARPGRLSKHALVVYTATAIVLWQQIMFEGGRFFPAALVLVMLSSRSTRGQRWTAAQWALAGTALAVFGWVFVQRPLSLDLDLERAYSLFAENFPLRVEAAQEARLGGDYSAPWFAVMMFWIYITQGANELDAVLSAPQFEPAWGAYQFPQFAQAAEAVLGVRSHFSVFDHLPNVGTYLTAYGGWYVDFGHVIALATAAVLGAITGRAATMRARGSDCIWAVMAPVLFVLALFSPIHSLLPTLWPALVAAWLSQTRPRLARRGLAPVSGHG